jgi:hypothetical protein
MCEKAANQSDLSDVVRNAAIEACIGMERRSANLIQYKRQFLPYRHQDVYARCVATSGSYSDASDCIDRAVLDLPRGSVGGVWRLQTHGKQDRIFWDIADCNSERVWGGGGVCISN